MDSGFVSHDTVLSPGQKIRVGIQASGEGANITWFHIGWDDGESHTILDSGLNRAELYYEHMIVKTENELETWTYQVMNKDRNLTGIRLTLHRSYSMVYGEIVTFPDVILGAQNNTMTGSFFSFSTGLGYSQDEAFTRQDSIDLLYYFDIYDATLASPRENDAAGIFTGPTGLANWSQKNETRYDTTSLTPGEFDQAQNDSLLLIAYEPVNLKRKVKFTSPGMVVSFLSPSGKIGLIKVMDITPGDSGSIRFSAKIQK